MGYFKSPDTRIAEAKQIVRQALAREGYEVARMDCVGSSYIVDRMNGDIDNVALLLLHLRGVAVPSDVRVGIHSIIMDDSTADYENERKL